MRVFAGKSLYGSRRTTVGVAFTQYRVYRAAQDFGVAGMDFFLFVRLRVFLVLGNLVTLVIEFLDGSAQLGN